MAATMVPAGPDAVRAALGGIGRLGPFFLVPTGASPGAAGWRPVADLYAGEPGRADPSDPSDALAGLVGVARHRLGTPESRVAASILHQGYAARLWSVIGGSVLTHGVLPALGPDELLWRTTAASLVEFAVGEPRGWWTGPSHAVAVADRVHRAVVGAHLRPLGERLRVTASVSPRILAGNTVSAFVGTLGIVPAGRTPAAGALVRALLDHPDLRGAGVADLDATPPSFRRASCCLYYRVPGGGICSDCVLRQRASRPR